ncbi:MAG: sulfite exporter TauE/SafE family protein [Myxococcota bacterium]|nr:sulfite exporter TauE/SafE family protein [Myxococcota bacterium]
MLLAVAGALIIGLSLGLMGSGGSILTVPILVYVVGQDEKVAIAGSLFVVGWIAAVGGLQHALRREVHWSSVLWFGLPGMAGTWLGAQMSVFLSGTAQLLLFVAVMTTAGVFMARPASLEHRDQRQAAWKISLNGLSVGALTGLVGVGGGFMIVPALVLLGGLPMHLAVGTSLTIIALQAFSGFSRYLGVLRDRDQALDWMVLGTFVGLGVVGALAGGLLSHRLPQQLLRKLFAGLLFVMAVAMLVGILS